jgi:putative transposase
MTYGFYLSFDHPSWTSVMSCLRMAVLPKDELVARSNCQSEWPLYGVPEVVIMDNGKEFHSRSLKAAAGHLGFEALNVPRRKGHLKGQVERRNGEVARDFLAFLPGRTFANVKERGDYPSEKKALADLTEAFTFWTVDIVHNRGHRALMMQTPLGRLEEIKGAGVKLPGDPKELDALIGLTVERTIQSKGIEHLGVWYKKPGLNALKKRPGHLGKLWMVKIDPLNANEVLLLDEQAGKWVHIPSTDPELTEGLTLADWRNVIAQARGRAKVSQAISRNALLAARLRLLEAGYEFGAGKVRPISEEDLDWVNSYQRLDGPKVLVEGGTQSPVDATRNGNRQKPLPSKGKVSASEGTPLPEINRERIESAPSIQSDIDGNEGIDSDEVEKAIKERRRAQSVLPNSDPTVEQQRKQEEQIGQSPNDEDYDPDDPENWS